MTNANDEGGIDALAVLYNESILLRNLWVDKEYAARMKKDIKERDFMNGQITAIDAVIARIKQLATGGVK